jgi:type I restriction enzyme S subunit
MEIKIPEGYSKTEMGILPKEWKVYSIGELVENGIIEKPLDGNHGNIHPKSTDFVDDGIPFIMANSVCEGILDLKQCNFITKEKAENLQKGFSITGDVLLTHKGTVGNVAIVGKISTPYIMLTPQVTYYRVKDKSRITNTFIRYYFESAKFQGVLQSLSGGGTRAYIGITKQRQLPFILPPLPEQKAIAQAVSDADAAVAELDRLITKKRNVKQGAMQQLLTGRKRLTGFGESQGYKQTEIGVIPVDWEATLLDSVAKRGSGHTPNKKHPEYWDGDIKWISLRDSDRLDALYIYDTAAKITPVGIANSSAVLHPVGTVVLSRDAGVGKSAITTDVMAVSQHFMAWQCGSQLDNHFLYYWLQAAKSEFERIAIGNTIKTIGLPYFKQLKIPFPPLAEQKAIAQVLSDMDAEIKALEQKRDKYKAIKQGMMQELLTGRTRLI